MSRSSVYHHPVEASLEDLDLMVLIDQQYMDTPFCGSRRLGAWLNIRGHNVNRSDASESDTYIGQASAEADASHGTGGGLPASQHEQA